MNPRPNSSPLWVVHAVTIGVSTAGAFAFSGWSLMMQDSTKQGPNWGIGLAAFVIGVGLSVYFVRFIRRFGVAQRSPSNPAPSDRSERNR